MKHVPAPISLAFALLAVLVVTPPNNVPRDFALEGPTSR